MAEIRVPLDQPTFLAAYNTAATGDVILLDASVQHAANPESIFKNITIAGDGGAAAVVESVATDDVCMRFRVESAGIRIENLNLQGGDLIGLRVDLNGSGTAEDCVIENLVATYALYVAGALSFIGGSIVAGQYAAMLLTGSSLDIDGTKVTLSGTQKGFYGATTANAISLIVENCDIESTSTAQVAWLNHGVAGSSHVAKYLYNTISHSATTNHTIAVGSESTGACDGLVNGYEVIGNTIMGHRGLSGDTAGMCHSVFVGHNVDGIVARNKIFGGGYALAWKGTGNDNTSGHMSFNIALNPVIGMRLKGVDGAIICNNTVVSYGSNNEAPCYITDNDGAGSSNGTVHVGNVYVQLEEGKAVAKTYGTVSFSRNERNAYVAIDGTGFKIGPDSKTWAEWCSAYGESGSYYIVASGSAWDVYTSESPTVVYRSLTACPIDTATGKIAIIPGNPLLKNGAIVTGVNDDSEIDAWGNETLAMPNIGADQYDYAPGFGPWSPFTSTMPALALSPDAPGKLKQVQTWSKADVTAEKINKCL